MINEFWLHKEKDIAVVYFLEYEPPKRTLQYIYNDFNDKDIVYEGREFAFLGKYMIMTDPYGTSTFPTDFVKVGDI